MVVGPGRWSVLLVALLVGGRAAAQDTASVRVHGTVKNEQGGAPLSGVEVRVVGSETTVQTSEDGVFELPVLPPGHYVVEARLIGFQPVRASFGLSPGQSAEIGFVLAPYATPLPEVTVAGEEDETGQMGEFFRRRAQGHGHFFTRTDIERLRPMRLSDMLDQVPGVRVECREHRCWLDMGRVQPGLFGSGNCHVQYFVDGVRYGTAAEEVDIDQFRPEDIEGIEIYRGMAGVPARYTGRDVRCGVVLLWIRIGRKR